MRICILARDIPPKVTDGIARNRWTYARQYQKAGCEVHVITRGVSGLENYHDGIYIHEVEGKISPANRDLINQFAKEDQDRDTLAYSHAVYERMKRLCLTAPVDIIDHSLWNLDGLVTKVKLPHIPMITRIDTTSRQLEEINHPGFEPSFSTRHILEQFMMNSSEGIIFNSWSICREASRLYGIRLENIMYAVIHHGIELPPHANHPADAEKRGYFKILVPGRMEKRKGTGILLQSVLPSLLASAKNFQIHFVGRDNSEWDGFQEHNGMTYAEYLDRHFAREINKRVFVHGYLPDAELHEHYSSADCVLAPSLYESFGLVYLEAISHNKPLVALNTGAARELFTNGKEALLASADRPEEIVDYLLQLQSDDKLRQGLVSRARRLLETRFSAGKMAEQSMHFIETVTEAGKTGTVYQLMNALTEGDGVSNFVRGYDSLLKENGFLTQIIGNHSSGSLRTLTAQIHEFRISDTDTLLYHYCGHCEWAEFANSLKAPRKILFFHNITPPHFFAEDSSEYKSAYNGLQQIQKLDNFDLYVALSDYSLQVLQQMIPRRIEKMVMPQILERQNVLDRPYLADQVPALRQRHPFHIIFVGRIVAHKKQADLIRFASYFMTHYGNNFHISIIGSGAEEYRKEIQELIRIYKLRDHVTLTGKITDEELYAYYRAADVYLSMSEHEGFGIPLTEAMVFEIPVLAYGVTAIPETVGENGCIFYEKDFEKISGLLIRLQKDVSFRQKVIYQQNRQLEKFTTSRVEKALVEMQVRTDEQFSLRRNNLANQGLLHREEFISYRDPGWIRRGEWSVADGRTLIHYGHESQSALEYRSDFVEADIFLVSNSHSGMVALYLNNEEVMRIDLYHPIWEVRRYRLPNRTGTLKRIKIVPLSLKNEMSSGSEVLVYGLLLRHPYTHPAGRQEIPESEQVSLRLISAKHRYKKGARSPSHKPTITGNTANGR